MSTVAPMENASLFFNFFAIFDSKIKFSFLFVAPLGKPERRQTYFFDLRF
jgi:hypothetical protein